MGARATEERGTRRELLGFGFETNLLISDGPGRQKRRKGPVVQLDSARVHNGRKKGKREGGNEKKGKKLIKQNRRREGGRTVALALGGSGTG